MKVVTAAEMRSIDRLTIERGIPSIVLMENAAHRVVEFLQETFSDLHERHVLIVCGKGDNGGDGRAIARILKTRRLAKSVEAVDAANASDLNVPETPAIVVDAILGTGVTGPARDPALSAIRAINRLPCSIPRVAVDIPSGLPSDAPNTPGEFVHVDYTVSFTAPKHSQVLGPTYDLMGRLTVRPVGSPPDLVEDNPELRLNLTTPNDLRGLFGARPKDSNKGMYGHVLVVGGSFGKSGAPTMAGIGAYRAGAGLVTVAVPKSTLLAVAIARPELMTEPLDETPSGRIASSESSKLLDLLSKMTVLALGPGLGADSETRELVRSLFDKAPVPAVLDADALNLLAGAMPRAANGQIRVLTPHPGEMSRLAGISTKEVQTDRLGVAQRFAAEHNVTVVLKGDRTVIAFPDGETWINPTGSPAMATGGTGDILTGMIAGLLAQHLTKNSDSQQEHWRRALLAAVWLHGRCGELAGIRWGEQSTLALDLLDDLPHAIAPLRSS